LSGLKYACSTGDQTTVQRTVLPPNAPNQRWQTDLTYLKVTGWGGSNILDDFSSYIVASKLCTTMKASDVTDALTKALQASGLNGKKVAHRPRLLSDTGSSCIAGDLADWLEEKGMNHVRGTPLHRQTQGKIARWHQTLKNRILLKNDYLPGDLEQKIGDFVAYYSHLRDHESIRNLTPAVVYFGRGQTILLERERIKRDAIKTRRWQHRGKAALHQTQMRQILSWITHPNVSNYLTTDTALKNGQWTTSSRILEQVRESVRITVLHQRCTVFWWAMRDSKSLYASP
jgi:hypothetical protein